MQKPNNSSHKKWALGWLILCLFAIIWLCSHWASIPINSSVLALLPPQSSDPALNRLEKAFTQRLDQQIVWMFSPGTAPESQLATQWRQNLLALPGVANVQGPLDASAQQAWLGTFYTYRNSLLEERTRQRMQTDAPGYAQWVLGQVYSAFAGVGAQELARDPLMLVRTNQMALMQGAGHMQLTEGWLSTRDAEGRLWYFLPGELTTSSFDFQQTQQLVSTLDAQWAAFQAQHPDARLLSRGSIFYSNYAAQQAKHDIQVIGSITIIGVVLLIFLVFRSLWPLFLCTLSVGTGALWGLLITVSLFGELHLMTIAMSLSIIGISVDYALYFLVERRACPPTESRWKTVARVRPALLLALCTSTCAYLLLTLAPFPGIRQLAVFAAAGLCAACTTVIVWHPLLVKTLPTTSLPGAHWLDRWLAWWENAPHFRLGLPLCTGLLACLGLAQLSFSDDITQLQSPPALIQAQDHAITQLTGQGMDQKWFLVSGTSPQQALERLDAFAPQLAHAKRAGWLESYRRLPLLSIRQQQADQLLLQAIAPIVQQALDEIGLSVPPAETSLTPLEPKTWLQSPISQGWRLLWLSLPEGHTGILVPVSGIKDPIALAALAQTEVGIHWLDRKAAFNALFTHYRILLTQLLGLAMFVVCLVSIARLGWRNGLRASIPSWISLATGLSALAFFGIPASLFSLLALILVLGIGINYTIFFSNPRGTPRTSLFAIFMAMLTTLMTLGVLVFSSTQAISSFGIVLSVGIFTAFLLAPLTANSAKPKVPPLC